jgi:hypothetical protein
VPEDIFKQVDRDEFIASRKEASAPPSPRHKKSFHAFGQSRLPLSNGTGGGAEPFHYRITCKQHGARSDNSNIQYL